MVSQPVDHRQRNALSEACHLAPFPRFFLVLGGTLLVFIGALQIIISIGFLVGVSIAWFDVPLAGVVAALSTVWGARRYFPGQRWIYRAVLVGVLLIVGAALVISTAFYDLSTDGRTYHTEAIAALAQGWNAMRDPPLTQGIMPQYVNFYAKGPWFAEAALYALTGNLQASKIFNLLWLAIAFCLAYPAFSTLLKSAQALPLALLIALNPVIVYQLLSLDVDGQFACMLSVTVSLLILIACQHYRVLMFWLAATVLMTINAKLTGPLYILILTGGFLIWYALTHRPQRTELVGWLAGSVLAGIFLVGYNPFITQYAAQTIARGDPFYPTTYAAITRIDVTAPLAFKDENPLTKVFRSLFSKSEDYIEQPVVYKIPFTVSQSELIAYYFPDARVGGFGPFFGGIILLLVLALAVSARPIRLLWPKVATIALLNGLIFLSVLINPAAWWARYVPQMWLLPILSVLIITVVARTRFQKLLVRLLLVALLLNSVIVLTANVVQQQRASNLITQALAQLRHGNDLGATIPVKFGYSNAADRILFDSAHIKYTAVDQLPCAADAQRAWPGTNTRYCLPAG